ncbi:hypothetical protein CPB86DRAFT_716564 [Serendipita vermifera]|nr:hypothetical protein CPB86DRAFT_716564 [Serendipita vermifera]
MSNSLGAYLRPNRILPTFTNGNGGHYIPVYDDTAGAPKDRRMAGSRSKRLLRYCFVPAVLVFIFLWWFSADALDRPAKPEPPPPEEKEDKFAHCEEAILERNVPSAHNITAFPEIYGHESTKTTFSEDPTKWAKIITAEKLMTMVENGEHPGPRILHQSWKTHKLPARFEKWSKAWRQYHGDDWLYVLWDDADNRKLASKHFPKYLEAYNALPVEIYRADMVRNMYMYHFGGVYADLDLVPLGSLTDHLPVLTHNAKSPVPIAYLGHMGDDNYEHSIPNAFMVSVTPGHPFWLRALDFVKEHIDEPKYNVQPEALTGPMALRTCYRKWVEETEQREGEGHFGEVRVLSNEKIYPFSWYDSPLVEHCLCRPHSLWFSEARCHWLHPDAWTITYWSHSWGDQMGETEQV